MPEVEDPTFYRSPAAAIAAPPEQLAYVAAFDPAGEQRDAMAVVDCDAGSSTYANGRRMDGPADRRATNSITSAGTPAPVRSATRAMKGRSSGATSSSRGCARRAPTCSTRATTRASLGSCARSSPRSSPRRPATRVPHTVHCGPGGIFMSNLGGANGGGGPGGVALIDHDTFEVTGAWETDRGDSISPTTCGGISTTTSPSPLNGRPRT